MPVLPGNSQNSPTLQQLANQLKSRPEFFNVLGGAAGYSTEPFLTVANEVLSRILAENMPWKWNRKVIPPFITVSLQQDYVTNITDIGWLEDGWRIDINNSTSNNNGAPKPIFPLETVRDLQQTAQQSVPFNVSYVPNDQAFLGLWQANTAYGCGYGQAQTPRTPIQQFRDENGNILFIDSSQLGLNIESPGYAGSVITPPGFYPYGVSGSTPPSAPPNATPGTMITDGTITWTVADPEGYAIRLSPTPALNGLCWMLIVNYQVVPKQLMRLQDTVDQIPFFMAYLFRQGLRAALSRENGSPTGPQMYAEWEETLMKACRAADRQQDDYALTPIRPIMGAENPWLNPFNVGASWPFSPSPLGY
jgi:hypothetical protein